jgi:hypothetical protein
MVVASRSRDVSGEKPNSAPGIPEGPPAPGRSHRTPPIGEWVLAKPKPSAAGYHIACPACVDGRVLLEPDPADPYGYLLRPDTCSADCDPATVMRWHAVRVGDMGLWFAWLRHNRTRPRIVP